MLDLIDASLRSNAYDGPQIDLYLAGGLAVNFHCGTRYTEDVDASFSVRNIQLPKDLTVGYKRSDGTDAFIYFDKNYNTSFALLHPEFEARSPEWPGIGNENRTIRLRVLDPLDLAVSKLSRFSDQDREDIFTLASQGYFTAQQLRGHAEEALEYYIGDRRSTRTSMDLACKDIELGILLPPAGKSRASHS